MNLKSVLLLVAFVSATLNIFAQNRISGTVKDQENNKNLAGVSVYIADLKPEPQRM
jgi:iron complex outermembrane receptor protein